MINLTATVVENDNYVSEPVSKVILIHQPRPIAHTDPQADIPEENDGAETDEDKASESTSQAGQDIVSLNSPPSLIFKETLQGFEVIMGKTFT